MVKTGKMAVSFFLVLVLLISLNAVVFAEEKKEITAYPGQTITNNEISAQNVGVTILYDVYAVASGPVADWVSPTTIYFGTVYAGGRVTKTFTIRVPEDAVVGQDYILTWEYYSDEGYEGSADITIHVTSFWVPSWIWIVIILAVVLAITVPGIVIAVVVSRKKKPRPPPPEVVPPEKTGSEEV